MLDNYINGVWLEKQLLLQKFFSKIHAHGNYRRILHPLQHVQCQPMDAKIITFVHAGTGKSTLHCVG